jgi:hypothetical protein
LTFSATCVCSKSYFPLWLQMIPKVASTKIVLCWFSVQYTCRTLTILSRRGMVRRNKSRKFEYFSPSHANKKNMRYTLKWSRFLKEDE